MRILDKVKVKNEEYVCTQVLFLEKLTVYRVHKILDDTEIFVEEKDNNFKKITDKDVLEEIYELTKVKDTDIIIN